MRTRIATCVVALILTACGGVPLVDWEHGAKRGEIVERVNSEVTQSSLPPCIAILPASARRGHTFVKVYRYLRRFISIEYAELPPGVSAAVGTQVEIYPAECNDGKLARIARQLPEH